MVVMNFRRDLQTIWDARIVTRASDRYVIQAMDYNAVIEPGQSASFGFGGSPGNVDRPPEFLGAGPMDTLEAPPAEPRIVITETVRNPTGFTADLTVENPSNDKIAGWTLSLQMKTPLTAITNGTLERNGILHLIQPSAAISEIQPRQSVRLRIEGTGRLAADSVTECQFNQKPCSWQVFSLNAPTVPSGPIRLDFDEGGAATQVTVALGQSAFRFLNSERTYSAVSANPSVAAVSVEAGELRIFGANPGRAGIRIDTAGGESRWLGIRVRNADGTNPGMPVYLSIGAMSEDTEQHLGFWRAIAPGPKNRRVDSRYIYLNGGPWNGWDTWGAYPGSRAVNYIRNSRLLGIIPVFVFYNIPDGSESYELDLGHAQDRGYMTAYFRNLKLFLDVVKRESPDDLVGVILEPDFLGYLAQNAGKPASAIPAATKAAYDSGVLDASDPQFPDTIQGLVQAINRSIWKHTPQVFFGWQMNLWASPAGGHTTPVPARGIIRLTDDMGVERGRPAIRREAAAITSYYLDAAVATHGAKFLSIDKYGLDAVGFQASAAADPASSVWFWNNDHWLNYLAFVRAIRDTSNLPVILWQMPVGRINGSTEPNPYSASGRFDDLPNTIQRYEDSSSTFFFGDTFTATGVRRDHFASNRSNDPGLVQNGDRLTWPEHMTAAAEAGVISILFGAGVGASTSSIGDPPTDGFWWITKTQRYYDSAVPLPW